MVTKSVMPDKVKKDLIRQCEIGRQLFETFTEESIKTDNINFWYSVKKQKLLTWKGTGKKMKKISTKEKVVELCEDRSLFARLLVVYQSQPDMNLQEAVGKHEFSIVPRSLFGADGLMLHSSTKSTLMHILEELYLMWKLNCKNQIRTPWILAVSP